MRKPGRIYRGVIDYNGQLLADTQYLVADGTKSNGIYGLTLENNATLNPLAESKQILSGERPSGHMNPICVVSWKKVTHNANVSFAAASCGLIARADFGQKYRTDNFSAGTNHIGPYILNSSSNASGIGQAIGVSPVVDWRLALGANAVGEGWFMFSAPYFANGSNPIGLIPLELLRCVYQLKLNADAPGSTEEFEVEIQFGWGEN